MYNLQMKLKKKFVYKYLITKLYVNIEFFNIF